MREKSQIKYHFFGLAFVFVPNLEQYEHKCQIFDTFETSTVRFFLVFSALNIKYFAFDTHNDDAPNIGITMKCIPVIVPSIIIFND